MTDSEVDLSHVRRMWDDDGASAHLGMEATVVEVDHAVVRMTVGDHMVNGHAIVHGGYLFTLADSAFALACNSRGVLTVAAGADITFVTSARLGDVLVAEARVRVDYGRSGITDVTVTREADGAVDRRVPGAVPVAAEPVMSHQRRGGCLSVDRTPTDQGDPVSTTTRMARIPLVDESNLLVKGMNWYTRRSYGAVMEPALALAHNRKVLTSTMRFQNATKRWDALDASLKHLAALSAAATVGCSWCLDFGYWVSHTEGVDRAKLEAITSWRTSDAYTDLERRVIEYAEAMSTTPMGVTDEMVAGLLENLSEAAVVELTAAVALENFYSRSNSALGFTSQGFKEQCDLRPAHG